MSTQHQQEALFKEGRLLLATQAYKSHKFKSINAAALAFDVSQSTLLRRINGVLPQRGSRSVNRLLTENEEEALIKWILAMDQRGISPRVGTVRQMALTLLTQRKPQGRVGKNWVTTFIENNEAIKARYNRKYDYQRAKCEDPELMQAWFVRIKTTIEAYGIQSDDIYNFDETGFQMGVIATAKVVTGSDRAGRPRTVQPGNREWVTIIETINTRGFAIPPLVIFEAVWHQASWYSMLPLDWTIGVSDNGWTTNEIGLYWLEHVFEKHTREHTIGTHRLLILDGHNSHMNLEFDQYCLDHNIIILCMPAHSSHLLQPLDVGCFSVLKRSYGRLVEQQTRLGIDHIDKQEFLRLYQQARPEALHKNNIQSGFRATGIHPYDPNQVLTLLHTALRTPSPQLLPQADPELWTTETPHNIAELEQQAELIKQRLKHRTLVPSSPTEQALSQLIKGCEMAMHSAVLLASENKKLLAENKHQKQKRAKKRSFISKQIALTGAEARVLIERHNNMSNEAVETVGVQPRRRAPPRCSLCGSLEHKAPMCSGDQRIQ